MDPWNLQRSLLHMLLRLRFPDTAPRGQGELFAPLSMINLQKRVLDEAAGQACGSLLKDLHNATLWTVSVSHRIEAMNLGTLASDSRVRRETIELLLGLADPLHSLSFP